MLALFTYLNLVLRRISSRNWNRNAQALKSDHCTWPRFSSSLIYRIEDSSQVINLKEQSRNLVAYSIKINLIWFSNTMTKVETVKLIIKSSQRLLRQKHQELHQRSVKLFKNKDAKPLNNRQTTKFVNNSAKKRNKKLNTWLVCSETALRQEVPVVLLAFKGLSKEWMTMDQTASICLSFKKLAVTSRSALVTSTSQVYLMNSTSTMTKHSLSMSSLMLLGVQ